MVRRRKNGPRRWGLGIVAGVAAAIGIAGVMIVWFGPTEVREAEGSIRSFATDASHYGVRHWMFVQMDSGRIARVPIWRDLPIWVGRRVVLREVTMPIFGAHYRFSRFIDEGSPVTPRVGPTELRRSLGGRPSAGGALLAPQVPGR